MEKEEKAVGYRYNAGKLDWSLIDFDSLSELVKVLEFGSKKYGRNNWRGGLKFNDTINSLMRHLIAFKEVGDNDEESGLCHLGHIMANTMFLQYMLKNRKDLDDRNIKNDNVSHTVNLGAGTFGNKSFNEKLEKNDYFGFRGEIPGCTCVFCKP